MDESGRVVQETAHPSDAPSFSNLDPTTSDAEALGGQGQTIWGTNVSTSDTYAVFKDFLRNYTKRYRMIVDGVSDEEIQSSLDANAKEYMETMKEMLTLGINSLNLDLRNLKAYPPTKKLWQQTQNYPQEVIPLMDQSIKDVMYEIAEAEMSSQRQSQSTTGQTSQRSRIMSSEPPVPSSERGEDMATPAQSEPEPVDLLAEVQRRNFKVRPFGLDQTVNMRELNPSGIEIHIFQR